MLCYFQAVECFGLAQIFLVGSDCQYVVSEKGPGTASPFEGLTLMVYRISLFINKIVTG